MEITQETVVEKVVGDTHFVVKCMQPYLGKKKKKKVISEVTVLLMPKRNLQMPLYNFLLLCFPVQKSANTLNVMLFFFLNVSLIVNSSEFSLLYEGQ